MTVGQDLVRLELGAAPEGGEKESAPSGEVKPADTESPQKDEGKQKAESTPPPPQETKPESKKQSPPPKKPEPKQAEAPKSSAPALGNREERRVGLLTNIFRIHRC